MNERVETRAIKTELHQNDISTLRITPIKRDLSNQFNHLINFASRFFIVSARELRSSRSIRFLHSPFHCVAVYIFVVATFFYTLDLFHSFFVSFHSVPFSKWFVETSKLIMVFVNFLWWFLLIPLEQLN